MKEKHFIRKSLSIILTIMLLITIFPLSAITANAKTITEINIVGIDKPLPGCTPDMTVDKNTLYTCVEVFWFVKSGSKTKQMKATDTFVEGLQYSVSVLVKVTPGNTFKTPMSVRFGGTKANSYIPTGYDATQYVGVAYTFATCSYSTINRTDTNLTNPVVGDKPSFYPTVPAGENYYVNTSSVIWYDDTAKKSMSHSDVFQENHDYILEFFLSAKTGYRFRTDSDGYPDIYSYINGMRVEVIPTESEGKVALIRVTYSFKTIISKISVSDIEIPQNGEHADYTCQINTAGYELDNFGIDWITKGGDGNELPIASTFTSGESYMLKIWLIAKDGYEFKTDGSGEVIADVEINGEKGEVYISDSKRCQITIVYDVPYPISNVAINNITTPKTGNNADYTSGTVAGTGYKITAIQWDDITEAYPNYIYNITEFSEGRKYRVIVTLETVDNYLFDVDVDYLIPDFRNATINGMGATVYSEGDKNTAYIGYEFITPIEVITVTGVATPIAGKTPDMTAVSTKAGYKIDTVEWLDTTSGSVKMNATDKFQAGHKYTVQISVSTTNGFKFLVEDGYQEISGTVNGNKAIAYGSHEELTAAIGYEFTIPAAHVHTPSSWQSDKDGHWKECIATSCKEITTPKANHEDKNGDEKCDTCGYSVPKPISKELSVKKGCSYVIDHKKKTVIINSGTTKEVTSANIQNEYFKIVNKDKNEFKNADIIGTGSIIQITDKSKNVLSEYTVIVLYDIDGNGNIQAADARLALRASVELEKLEGIYKIAADVDSSGEIKASDARTILRKSVGLN